MAQHPRMVRLQKTKDYVDTLAACMGLKDWVFSVHEGVDDPDSLADCLVTKGMRHASIGFSHEFWDKAPDVQRLYVTHELVHCHVAWMEHVVEDACKPHLPPAALVALLDLHTTQNELATDAISSAWSKTLPLPPKGMR